MCGDLLSRIGLLFRKSFSLQKLWETCFVLSFWEYVCISVFHVLTSEFSWKSRSENSLSYVQIVFFFACATPEWEIPCNVLNISIVGKDVGKSHSLPMQCDLKCLRLRESWMSGCKICYSTFQYLYFILALSSILSIALLLCLYLSSIPPCPSFLSSPCPSLCHCLCVVCLPFVDLKHN